MKAPQIALQTWTIRNDLLTGADEILAQVRKIGFEYLEVADTGRRTPKAFQELCKGHELKIMGTHDPCLTSDDPQVLIDATKRRAAIFGSKFSTVWWDSAERNLAAKYQEYADLCNKAGESLRNDGITLCYHCYHYDLVPLEGEANRSGLDVLLSVPKQHLCFELDTRWLNVPRPPVSLQVVLDKFQGRCRLVHLNDVDQDDKQATLGKGIIDWRQYIAALRNTQAEWFIIEHTDTPNEWIKTSYRYLTTLMKA